MLVWIWKEATFSTFQSGGGFSPPPPPSTHDHPLFIEQQDSHPPLLQSYFDSQNAHFSPLDVFLLHPRRVEPLKRGGGGRKGPSSSSSSAFLSATSTSSLLIKQRTWARGDRGQKREKRSRPVIYIREVVSSPPQCKCKGSCWPFPPHFHP